MKLFLFYWSFQQKVVYFYSLTGELLNSRKEKFVKLTFPLLGFDCGTVHSDHHANIPSRSSFPPHFIFETCQCLVGFLGTFAKLQN